MKNPFKIKINKAGEFTFGISFQPHRQSVATFKYKHTVNSPNQYGRDVYECKHGWHIQYLQVFFLWWVVGIDMSLRHDDGLGSTSEYVSYSPNPLIDKIGCPFDEVLPYSN